MAHISTAGKALTVNPLKVSQPMGATLALLGLARSLPLEHGALGCTAFSKVFFTRHFQEPIPLQTTAMDHLATVMGADDQVVEALTTIATRHHPNLIGIVSTGLAETQGVDLPRAIQRFRAEQPELAKLPVVAVNTPDTLGSLESGFALAVEALINTLVPASGQAGHYPWQVNLLVPSMLTPGDVEALRNWVESFGLQPVILPDLGDSLDGHLEEQGFTELTRGGTSLDALRSMGKSIATLVVGRSLHQAADLLRDRTGVPDYRFDSLMGLAACDRFTAVMTQLSGPAGGRHTQRHRAQLMDAMLDCQVQLGGARIGVAADPDLLAMLTGFLQGVGAEPVALVASHRTEALTELPVASLQVGDLEDLEVAAARQGAQLLLGNAHVAPIAQRLGIPLLRTGFPLHDVVGGHARQWIGYQGSRQALFDLANLLGGQRDGVAPYQSIFRQPLATTPEPL